MITVKPICFFLFFGASISCKDINRDAHTSIKTVRFDNSILLDSVNKPSIDSVFDYPDDGVIREVPKYFRLKSIRKENKKIESALEIGSLENGFQNSQFRISGDEYNEYRSGWTRLLVFRYIEKWSADIYYLRFAGEEGFQLIIDSLQYQKYSLGIPKMGWKPFIDSVTQMGLFSLPNSIDIPGYGDGVLHENSYTIEVASTNFYKVFSYRAPMRKSDTFHQAKQLMNIISLIKKQFRFPQPLTPPDEAVEE